MYWKVHITEFMAIRAKLKERFMQSPLGQPTIIAAALKHACETCEKVYSPSYQASLSTLAWQLRVTRGES